MRRFGSYNRFIFPKTPSVFFPRFWLTLARELVTLQGNKAAHPVTSDQMRVFNACQLPTRKTLSDHEAFVVMLSATIAMLVWNVLMQCRTRNNGFNNGFGWVEDDQQYITRVVEVVRQLQTWIANDSSIAMVALQEAPNTNKFITVLKNEFLKQAPSGWENFRITINPFGVATIFKNSNDVNENVFFKNKRLLSWLNPKLRERVLSFKSSESYGMTIIHVPFKNSKESYKTVLHLILLDMLTEIQAGMTRCHHIIGDKNMSHEEELHIFNEVCEELRREKTDFASFDIHFQLAISPQGHTKRTSCGAQSRHQVDSGFYITITQRLKEVPCV